MKLLSAIFVFGTKLIARLLYRTNANWMTGRDQIQWEQIRLVIVLNHTSLFEPLFISVIPNKRLWRAIDRLVIPIADVTMSRPLVGFFLRLLVPNAIPITRKRDETWDALINKVRQNSLILVFPEGRMKRKDGLDKNGKPMSVKGGVVDILEEIPAGKILMAYSGGLHHVQAPGELVPKVFQEISIGFEEVDIASYKAKMKVGDFRTNVIADLELRLKTHCK